MEHRFGVAPRQDQARGLAVQRADGAEDVGGCRALVVRCGWTGAAPRPTPGDLVLLPDPGFIAKPDLYVGAANALLARDLAKARWETFLKASIAPCAWA